MSLLFTHANNATTTENGAEAFKSTLSKNLDLFFIIGTARGTDVSTQFKAAYKEDADLAIRNLLWARDVRGGAGERQRFRDLLKVAIDVVTPLEMSRIIRTIPEVGRWDDLFTLVGTQYEEIALSHFAAGISSGFALAAKWAPRKGAIAAKLRAILDLTPKQYRKLIVGLTKVVETQMCAGEWESINFSHVPSQASRIYSKAFRKHEGERYNQYLEKVMTGEATMNASAVFPNEVLNQLLTDADQADAQWKSLPNYLEGVDERILVVSDVSGSMGSMYGSDANSPIKVSVALGVYFSERLEGVFKDNVITFSEKPKFHLVKGTTLSERATSLSYADWGMSTNLERVFTEVLKTATRNSVPESEMPTKLLIISDMQFNQCMVGTALENITAQYDKAGYTLPQVVFWNVADRSTGNVPVTFNQKGVALVSGNSPAVIKSVLGGDVSPVPVMLKALMVERYS